MPSSPHPRATDENPPISPAPTRPISPPPTRPTALTITSRWLEREGRPWFPITGEVHYSRLPCERWEEVLGHARAGGLTSVACYVFWQAHEPEPGTFCWNGNRDLRAFVELAGSHGLEVLVRLGPWAHGEARYGGFPDWLVERGLPTRTDHPDYLSLVRRLYRQIAAQLTGLGHGEGGPVIGAQVENELYDQPGHLATLRTIAEDAGLELPIWTATGWGGAQVPDTLLPVYSAYTDGFWAEDEDWPAFAAAHFDYAEVRDDLTVGADLREALDGVVVDRAPGAEQARRSPFVTCELGGGMHVAYHRRPLVTGRDVAALALAKIGSGSVWQGYYMYAGGTQRTGAHGSEQESHATGYPNDVPTRSYDFHAPVGEHQQIRDHHHLLRRQHLWLATDGSALATMTTSLGDPVSDDPNRLRWAVRSDGRRGYLFLSTYQPARRPLPAQPGVQVTAQLAAGPLTVPHVPVDLPAGISVAWPLRYPLTAELELRSATAELLTRITGDGAGELVVLVATAGVPVELVVAQRAGAAVPVPVSGAGVGTAVDGGTRVALHAAPGPSTVIGLPGVDVLILDEASANRLYRLEVDGRDRLVLSDAPVYSRQGHLVLHSSTSETRVCLLPAPEALSVAGGTASEVHATGAPADGEGERATGTPEWPAAHLDEAPAGHPEGAGAGSGQTAADPWRSWTVRTPAAGGVPVKAELRHQHRPLARLPKPARGGPMHRLSAPQDFSAAARYHLDLPGEVTDAVDRVLLRITWTGDVGRALVGEEVISDHFWHGRVWDVDLTPWREKIRRVGVTLELLPWRPEVGVWLDPSVRDLPAGVTLTRVEAIRVARTVLTAGE